MFAIAFDMDIKELRNSYGELYNNAYYEIKIILRKQRWHGKSLCSYLCSEKDLLVQECSTRHSCIQGWKLVGLHPNRERRRLRYNLWSHAPALTTSPANTPTYSRNRIHPVSLAGTGFFISTLKLLSEFYPRYSFFGLFWVFFGDVSVSLHEH